MLPSGYLQLEYIQTSGTQRINTGLSAPNGFIAKMRVSLAAASAAQALIGAIDNNPPYNRNYFAALSNLSKWNVGAYDDLTCGGTISAGVYYELEFSTVPGNVYCKVDGIEQSVGASSNSARSAKEIYLFDFNYAYPTPASAKMCYCQILSGSGEVQRDMIPAKRLSDGAVGMYDAVNDAFYSNAGTGSFVAGPYLADEKDVVLLEYIESSGTQHIDSGYKPNEKTRMTLVGEPSASGALYCANNASGRFGIYLFTTQIDMAFGSSGYVSATKSVSYPETVTLRNGNLTSNSGTYSFATQSAFQTTATLPLFAEIDKPSPGGRIYSAQIFESNEIERDYYPARFAPTSEAGLYDAANGTFYINAGTGAFIEGPEIPQDLGAPENLRVESATDSAISIAWDAVDKATGYKVFRNYVPVAESATTTYTDYAPEPYNGYVYGVVAYNDDMQSAMVTVRAAAMGGDPILDLVTDRTQEDVDYVLSLMRKGLNGMTDDEKLAFTKGLKGAYNATDLNRVESAVEMLPAFLNGLQASINSYLASIGVAEDELYSVPYERVEQLETKRDWSIVDIPYADGFARYLANIATARGWLPLPADTPAAPDSINRLTYTKANAIEQILLAIYNTANEIKADKLVYADRAKDAWKYCGTFNCGQEVIF